MKKVLALLAALAVLAGIAVAYTAQAAHKGPEGERLELAPGRVVFRDLRGGPGRGRMASVPLGGADRTVGKLTCARVYAAGGTGVCLRTEPGPVARAAAVVLDRHMREVRRVPLSGIPNRARVSASGRMVSWTVFVAGDSYNGGSFSTRTGIFDTRTGRTVTSLEDIALTVDGRRYRSADLNYWGVTFAGDDNRFYATVATRGKTYLVEGDFSRWTARALRENAECPSLAPDGRRLVFKKRVSRDPAKPWRLYALDLGTLHETALAEQRSVDDQAAWLDDRTVMYGRGSDVWAVPADGSGAPRMMIADAGSAVALR